MQFMSAGHSEMLQQSTIVNIFPEEAEKQEEKDLISFDDSVPQSGLPETMTGSGLPEVNLTESGLPILSSEEDSEHSVFRLPMESEGVLLPTQKDKTSKVEQCNSAEI